MSRGIISYTGMLVKSGTQVEFNGMSDTPTTIEKDAELVLCGISNGDVTNNGHLVVHGSVNASVHNRGTCEMY